jgi:arabinogalactan endo-1,4-beta-galactosidase
MRAKRNWLILLVAALAIVAIVIVIQQTLPPPPLPVIANPGFEPDETGNALTGWTTTGVVESEGHSGEMRLTHAGGGLIETSQTFTNMPNGWYTLKAWVRSSGKQQDAYIALKDCGADEQRASVPIVRSDKWLHIVVSAEVKNGQCTLSLVSEAGPEDWVSFDDIEFVPGRAALSIMGADISSLKKSEDLGGVYANENGTIGDALTILSEHGMNYARIRVWVNSPDGYHGKAQLLEMAKRLKEKGIKLLVDFHYSDEWADPGKQYIPASWEGYTLEQLKQALYDHTFDVCNSLKAQGTPPDMVQVGNEINSGMLWPEGHNRDWDNLAALLKEGHRAVKDCSPSIQVMLHIAEGGDNELARWWFDNAVQREVSLM